MNAFLPYGLLCLLLAVILFFAFTTGLPLGSVTLCNQEESVTLSGFDALALRMLFTFRFYRYGIGGCPFEDGVSLTIGNREFALATDDCASAKDLKREKYLEFNRLEWEKIEKLYAKHFETTLLD